MLQLTSRACVCVCVGWFHTLQEDDSSPLLALLFLACPLASPLLPPPPSLLHASRWTGRHTVYRQILMNQPMPLPTTQAGMFREYLYGAFSLCPVETRR